MDKVVDVLSTRHGAWSSTSSPRKESLGSSKTSKDVTDGKGRREKIEEENDDEEREFWKLDVWEDDARRRRR